MGDRKKRARERKREGQREEEKKDKERFKRGGRGKEGWRRGEEREWR